MITPHKHTHFSLWLLDQLTFLPNCSNASNTLLAVPVIKFTPSANVLFLLIGGSVCAAAASYAEPASQSADVLVKGAATEEQQQLVRKHTTGGPWHVWRIDGIVG